jgi:hypothetical protein
LKPTCLLLVDFKELAWFAWRTNVSVFIRDFLRTKCNVVLLNQ